MIEAIAIDTNVVVNLVRFKTTAPLEFRKARQIIVPLHVAGELYAGARSSRRVSINLPIVEGFLSRYVVLTPDDATARKYGEIRAQLRVDAITASKTTDLWIAALCIQHHLPLLTSDHGFDVITELKVIHW